MSKDRPGLGDRLGGLVDLLTDTLVGLNLATLSGEGLSREILVFLGHLRDQIAAGGEMGYTARRVALFLVESLSLGLRKGLDPENVPLEHASILDATYQKIQATKSGITGDEPDVGRINQQVDSAQKFFQEALTEAGLLKRIPAEGGRRIVIAGG